MDTSTRGCKMIAVSRKVTRYVLSFKLTILHFGTKRGEYEIAPIQLAYYSPEGL